MHANIIIRRQKVLHYLYTEIWLMFSFVIYTNFVTKESLYEYIVVITKSSKSWLMIALIIILYNYIVL